MNVEELLTKKDITYTFSGGDCVVRCFNPEHEDKNPSMRISRTNGKFHCFSCGFKGEIFDYFDAPKNHMAMKVEELLSLINKIESSYRDLDYPEDMQYFIQNGYRHISAKTYKKFEAFTSHEDQYEDRVVFPISDITGRVYAHIGRHRHSDAGRDKYKVYPHSVKVNPYPAKVVPIHNSIILVEGIFDMLNLHDKGLTNAVCIFGVSTIKDHNCRQILKNYNLQGARHIYLLLDEDKAGRSNAKGIRAAIRAKTDFTVEIIEGVLGDGEDPGSLSKQRVEKLRKRLYE